MVYSVRLDYSDETFEVVAIPADSIGEAAEIARRDPEVAEVTVLGMRDDTTRAQALAFG